MKPLPEEVEIQKVLDALRKVRPDWKVPELHQFNFDDRYSGEYGHVNQAGQISLSMKTIENRTTDNIHFIYVIVHEITHYNFWNEKHSRLFHHECDFATQKTTEELWKDIKLETLISSAA
jgi:predicted SprT family Zn-dependent metalloprotease